MTTRSFRTGQAMCDGPRYRMIGNSMAVNVMRWIGQRIDLVEQHLKGAGMSGEALITTVGIAYVWGLSESTVPRAVATFAIRPWATVGLTPRRRHQLFHLEEVQAVWGPPPDDDRFFDLVGQGIGGHYVLHPNPILTRYGRVGRQVGAP